MATPLIERPLPDLQVDAIAEVDAEYMREFGPQVSQWPRTVRGEYLEAVALSRRPHVRESEMLTTHPRRSSAASRRHHQKYLGFRLQRLVPGAATVLVVPMWADLEAPDAEPVEHVFLVLVRNARGERLKPPPGSTPQIVRLLQAAFVADWSVAQTWRAADGSLTARRPRVPAHMERRWI
ncbi:hypothetical protein [Streptomyces sp. CBMA152]|uniref:hypothetical protein n=1 Tax=Streptomyces sp. CBMA152 TaxID=1896312 RepID=UPI001660E980|nr:hypothetical protein [Streptomyces sp. CBMA152]MBD0743495.1 hypothetical protein [Streptomyces sp. CBMA152]